MTKTARKDVVTWRLPDGSRHTVCDQHVGGLPGNREFVERFVGGWCEVCTPDVEQALRDERLQ
jgi:hypothetical protein